MRDSCAGGSRNDTLGGNVGAAEVGVHDVGDDPIIGVRVGGGHEAVDDAECLVEDLNERREVVGADFVSR
jgi:hypothetical protein